MRRISDLQLEISFKNYRQAEILSYLSVVERIDSHSIRYNREGHGRRVDVHAVCEQITSRDFLPERRGNC